MTKRAIRWTAAFVAAAAGTTHLVVAGISHGHLHHQPALARYTEDAVFGSRYPMLLSGLALILLARPLAHGKRTAWLATLVVAAISIPGRHHPTTARTALVLDVVLVTVLVVTRRSFRVRSDPDRARQGWILLGSGIVVMLIYSIVGLLTLDLEFRHNLGTLGVVRESLHLLLFLPAAQLAPATRHADWFVESVRIGTLAVVIVAVVRLVATVVLRRGHSIEDEAIVRALLADHATTDLAPFHLQPEQEWFIGSDGQAFIGYRLVGRTAVALGEPIGAAGSVQQVLEEFLELCSANGWTPAFHQVTEPGRAQLAGAGLLSLKIGEEAVVPLDTWDLAAAPFKSLRSALRRVERSGYRLVELAQPLDDDTMQELQRVSDEWLGASGHRERTFTVGRFDPDYLRSSTVLAAVGPDGRIGAFANILSTPARCNGNFDLMRRASDTPNGVMEYLFVGLIDRFRGEGRTGLSLGLAPLAGVAGESLADRALHALYERGNDAFNFQGLHAFKEKWQPRWEPRYLCYRHPAELPIVAAAVARAGEIPHRRPIIDPTIRTVRRFPVTTGVLAVVLWFMALTQFEPTVHAVLLRQLGLSWADVAHLQLWRLGTSQLIQTKAGLAWGNIALLLPMLPLAEWRLGSRRTVLVLALGDWLSTLPVLVGLRLMALGGNATAARDLLIHDAGSSSGAWALAIAIALGIRNRRSRWIALAGVIGFNLAALAVQRELVDVQHLAALAAAVMLTWVLDRRARARAAGMARHTRTTDPNPSSATITVSAPPPAPQFVASPK